MPQANLSSIAPPPEEVLMRFFNWAMENIHTCCPGEVISYDAATQRGTVQPVLQRDGRNLPAIQEVPFVFPSSGGAWVKFPVSPKDTVLLVFSERAIDEWKADGGLVTPAENVTFDLSDAIALVGLRPGPGAIKPKGASDSLEICLGGTWIEITKGGKVKVTNGAVDVLDILDKILDALIAASPNPIGSFPPQTANFIALKASLSTLKG